MGRTTRLALGSALACVLTAGAAATSNARPPDPVFRVSVKSTYVDHHVTHLVYTKDTTNGCHWRYDLDATQTIDVSTVKPVVRTLSQLTRGGNNFVPMAAREQRNGSSRDGWEEGCPALKDQPAQLEDVSACGQHSYSVANTSVGYLPSTANRFAFVYKRSGPDPYGGLCFPELWVDDTATSANPTSSVDFPPGDWGVGANGRPVWTTLARSRLKSGKTIVVRWSDTAKNTAPYLEPDPTLYEQNTDSDEWTVSWVVTLVPLKPHR